MNQTLKQRGFVMVEGVLAVVALAGIAAAGYFAYQDHQAHTSQKTASKTTSSVAATTQTSTPATNILKVAALNFEITLPAALTDVQFATSGPSGTQYTDTNGNPIALKDLGGVSFSSKSLASLDSGCDITGGGGGAVSYTLFNDDPDSFGPTASGPSAVKKLGSQYLALNDKQVNCSNPNNATAQSAEDTLTKELSGAFNTATPLQ